MKELLLENVITYLQNQGPEIAKKLLLGIVVFFIIFMIIKYIVGNVKNRIEANSLVADVYAKKNSKLVGTILFIVLMIFNVLATFEIIGFDVAIIMGGISLSLGFAMETTIGNLVSGVFILTNKKIKLGDFVELLGKLNIKGVIEEVNVRYSVIRTFDRRRTIIPNSIIAKTPIRTLKSEPLLKGEISFTIPRHTPFAQVKELFYQAIRNNNKILYPEYSTIMIAGFNTSGTNLKGFFFSNPAKKAPVIIGRELKEELFSSLKKYGINVPYKHITISTE